MEEPWRRTPLLHHWHDAQTKWVKSLLCGDYCSSTLSNTHTKDTRRHFSQPPLNSGQNRCLKSIEGEYFQCTAGPRRKPTLTGSLGWSEIKMFSIEFTDQLQAELNIKSYNCSFGYDEWLSCYIFRQQLQLMSVVICLNGRNLHLFSPHLNTEIFKNCFNKVFLWNNWAWDGFCLYRDLNKQTINELVFYCFYGFMSWFYQRTKAGSHHWKFISVYMKPDSLNRISFVW